MSEYISLDNTELNDKQILEDLEKAREMYEDGALLETADILQNIAEAIRNWDPDCQI